MQIYVLYYKISFTICSSSARNMKGAGLHSICRTSSSKCVCVYIYTHYTVILIEELHI